MLFNEGWTFTKTPLCSDAKIPDTHAFVPVPIPHDWLIADANNLYESGEGWYRKVFPRPLGERAVLLFDGVYMDSTVYINRQIVHEWKYGYSAFEVDMTPYIKEGDNEILVRCLYRSPNSRWYSGAGIYRSVRIRETGADYLCENGVYVSPHPNEDGTWRVCVDTEVVSSRPYALEHSVTEADGTPIASGLEPVIAAPVLWSPGNPFLYTLQTRLIIGGKTADTWYQRFGLKSVRLDPERGFILNGQSIKLYGVCEHHDLGALGAAFHTTAMKRKLTLLQSMGVNALRTSHNMPAREVMDLCDEMGLLVISEAFDMWELSKTDYDYARFFTQWMPRDVRSWIRRDRNHACLIMWSIGNEIYDTYASARGLEITRSLMEQVRVHDPRHHAAITIGSNYMPWDNANACADLLDAAGYNYAEYLYDAHHAAYPQRVIYGSETASTVQSRGIYHFPYEQSVLADDDEQCSSLGNAATSWGAPNTEYNIIMDRNASYSMGQFIWTGFDYIGEPTPYHTKNSYFGQIDTAGFPKDSFYLYQSAWTDYRTKPMVHITPYWDFSPNQMIDIRVCSNAPQIELFFNGVSQGAYAIDRLSGTGYGHHWKFPYITGVLTAHAYDENGRVIATDSQSSFADTAALVLTADKTEMKADGSDLIFVSIQAADAQGNPVQNANNRLTISVAGAGRLVGLDNGDSTDRDSYKGDSKRLFSGKLLAIIQADDTHGPIVVTAASRGIPTAGLQLKSLPHVLPEGASRVFAGNTPSPQNDEIPIRKIELICPDGMHMDADCPKIRIQARLYPQNATYEDVTFRLTNRAGINTHLAALEACGHEAVITALGDGEVWLRAMTHNGRAGYAQIARIPLTISGLGRKSLSPYRFITGGLYDLSNATMGNGNDRGVSTLRDGVSHVGYSGLDFGPKGSNKLTLHIFALSSDPFTITLSSGMPDEAGTKKIAELVYDKGSVWNTYIPADFNLPERLTGMVDICFSVDRKMHFGGFVFHRAEGE